MHKNFIILFFLSIFSLTIFAEPAPFGLEINKTTYEEVKKKYFGVEGYNNATLDSTYFIDATDINHQAKNIDLIGKMQGIKSLITTFDKNNKLIGIEINFKAKSYDEILYTLKTLYKCVGHDDIRNNSGEANFEQDHTIVVLKWSDSDTTLSYFYNDFLTRLFQTQNNGRTLSKVERDNL